MDLGFEYIHIHGKGPLKFLANELFDAATLLAR